MTQNNLGAAYRNRIRGKKAENLELAIACYTQALQVRTRKAFPQDHAETLYNLGRAHQKANQLQQAHDAFKDAIDMLELLRSEIFSGDEIKQKFAETYNRTYQRMVEVCLELSNYTEAIEYVERSKARDLVELLTTTQLKPKGVSEEIRQRLNRLQRDYLAEQRLLNSMQRDNTSSSGSTESGTRQARFPQSSGSVSTAAMPDATRLIQLRQQLDKFIADEITPHDSSFRLGEKVQPINFDDIHAILDDRIAILEWYITAERIQAFIITRNEEEPGFWQSSPQDLQDLENW